MSYDDYQSEWIRGLYDMAEFFENHSHLIPRHSEVTVDLFAMGDDPVASIRTMIKGTGRWDKSVETVAWFELRRWFGPHHIAINASRDAVCERVQVGTRTVEKPDPDAPHVTVDEPIYEYHCPDSILAVS